MALSGTATVATAASTSSRPLLVPAADVLARNMRAIEQTSERSGALDGSESSAPSLFMGLGAFNEDSARKVRHKEARFRSAAATAKPNPLTSLITRLLAQKTPSDKQQQSQTSPSATVSQPTRLQKLIPTLEKAVPLVSRLPDPLFVMVSQTLVILIIRWVRPHWLKPLAVRIPLCVLLFIPILLSALWKRGGLFTIIREGRPLRTHPAELRLDGPEAEVLAREVQVEKALETLRKNEAKLDALKKELAKEGNSRSADGQIIPSRRAAEMIAAGALGSGFDAETAAEVEQRRREENVRRSREEWRARAELAEDDYEMKERLRLLADHAATAYAKRTKELKTRTSPGGATFTDKIGSNLRNKINAGRSAALRQFDEDHFRMSRHSERSMPVSGGDGSTSRRRLTFFRRKRRDTAPELDTRRTMSEAGRAG